MKRDDTVYLQHILDAILKVKTYLADIDEVSFFSNSLVQDGVIRQIEIRSRRSPAAAFGLKTPPANADGAYGWQVPGLATAHGHGSGSPA
jgi:hypothetical protein